MPLLALDEILKLLLAPYHLPSCPWHFSLLYRYSFSQCSFVTPEPLLDTRNACSHDRAIAITRGFPVAQEIEIIQTKHEFWINKGLSCPDKGSGCSRYGCAIKSRKTSPYKFSSSILALKTTVKEPWDGRGHLRGHNF